MNGLSSFDGSFEGKIRDTLVGINSSVYIYIYIIWLELNDLTNHELPFDFHSPLIYVTRYYQREKRNLFDAVKLCLTISLFINGIQF